MMDGLMELRTKLFWHGRTERSLGFVESIRNEVMWWVPEMQENGERESGIQIYTEECGACAVVQLASEAKEGSVKG